MRVQKLRIFVLVLAVAAVLGVRGPLAHGLGETYKLTPTPAYSQESDTPGILLVLNVSGATVGLTYSFTFQITDPTGATHNANNNSYVATTSSFLRSAAYPSKFGTNINYVGNYTVNVQQTSPTPVASAATGQFRVGLTDSLTYQRTTQVSILARGYGNGEIVTIDITHGGSSVLGYPATQSATASGLVARAWQISRSSPLGVYTATVTGASTTKTPPDSQTFNVIPAVVQISQLTITQTILARSQSQEFRFTAIYPNSAKVTTGSAIMRIVESDGIITHNSTATYNSTLGVFDGRFQIPLSSEVGAWVASVDQNSFDDGYGNIGPVTSVLRGFAVQAASLTVTVSISNSTFTTGNVVAVYAKVVTPGGYNFVSGSIVASLSFLGRPVGHGFNLSYDQTNGRWFGSFMVNATNPSGLWLAEVIASDAFGNTGQGSTQVSVFIPAQSQPNSTFDYWWFLIALVTTALIVSGLLFFNRRRVVRKVLKVDLQAVHAEAQKVETQDFFKKIQEHLKQQKKEQSDVP